MRIGAAVLPDRGYGIAYGSKASGLGSPVSDLDLLYVMGTEVAGETRRTMAASVVDLHRPHGLGIDEEVSHEVKLTATPSETAAALTLAPFTAADGRSLRVPPVAPAEDYLNSPEFKHRLLLGALTGPHMFLCGDLTRYRRDQDSVVRAVAVLVSAMLADKPTVTCADVRAALLTHSSGAAGKDHLGYRPGPDLEHLARSVVAELAALRVVVRFDVDVFEHRHPVTSNLLALTATTASVPSRLRLPAKTITPRSAASNSLKGCCS